MPHADTEREVHKETIGFLQVSNNEDPELTQARARGWYLARGCTVHVCNSRDMFVDYEPLPGYVGVVGFGTVMLPLTTGKVLILKKVFHIPTMAKSLISVVKLTDIGFGVSFWGDEWVKVVHDETLSFLVADESPKLIKTRARGWVLSTRCTVHVCNSRDMFVDYHPLNGHEANVVLGGRAEVAGVVSSVSYPLADLVRAIWQPPCIWWMRDVYLRMVMSKAYVEGGLLRLSLVDERQDGIEGSE
ncbi:hypothetical protein Tco_0442466 [Tanacetum coccineum]